MAKTTKGESKKGGVTNRGTLYAYASAYSFEAIDFLVEIMRDEQTQKAVRMGAARALLDKSLPDLKSTELTGQENGPIEIILKAEKLPSYE